MKRLSIFLIILISININAFGQANIHKLSNISEATKYSGIYYSLPQTTLKIDVTVQKKQHIKGPYAEYAHTFLGIKDVLMKNNTEYEIVEIALSQTTQPDPSQQYMIVLNKKKNSDYFTFELSDNNMLTEIFTEGIPGKEKYALSDYDFKDKLSASSGSYKVKDTIIRRIYVDTTVIEKLFVKEVTGNKPIQQQAKETADVLLKIDEHIMNLLTGYQEVAYDKGAIEFMYQQLTKLKKDYLQLFKGVQVTEKQVFTFFYTPDNTSNEKTLANFSKSTGITSASDYEGNPLKIRVVADAANNQDMKNSSESQSIENLPYRIPALANIIIDFDNEIIFNSDMFVSQYGVISTIPVANIKKITLNGNSGGIKSVKLK